MRGLSAGSSVVTGEPQSGPSGITRLNASIPKQEGTRPAWDISEIRKRGRTCGPSAVGGKDLPGILLQ